MPEPKLRTRKKPNRWWSDLSAIVIAVLVVFSARHSLADHYYVPTGSMIPSVEIGDRVWVSKASYSLRIPFTQLGLKTGAPDRGDVVVLESPDDGSTLLKRVAAVPGDSVAVRRGRLELNGTPVLVTTDAGQLRETHGSATHPLRLDAGGGPSFGPVVVPPGHYLVLGDNRGNSRDGRMFGFVAEEAMMGRVGGTYFRGGRLHFQRL
jgi:signal peptidase I